MTLGQIIDQLAPAARVRVYCLNGEKFDFMALMSKAAVSHSIVSDMEGEWVESWFCRIVEGVAVEVVYRKPASSDDVRKYGDAA